MGDLFSARVASAGITSSPGNSDITSTELYKTISLSTLSHSYVSSLLFLASTSLRSPFWQFLFSPSFIPTDSSSQHPVSETCPSMISPLRLQPLCVLSCPQITTNHKLNTHTHSVPLSDFAYLNTYMFQSIEQILTLDNLEQDKLNKYKRQFLNGDF